MKAVILCAGEGTRMRPLTFTIPKQLLKVGDKAVLEHIFHELPDQIDEVILVVKYLAGQIQDYFGEEFLGKKIHYVTQVSKDYGTWIGLNEAKHLLGKEKFLVLLGDDILDKESIESCLEHDFSVLVKEVEDPRRFGVVLANEHGKILDFIEKPEEQISNLANTGVQVLDYRIFNYPARQHKNGEYYLTDSVARLAKDHDVFIKLAKSWISMATPEDLESINADFKAISSEK